MAMTPRLYTLNALATELDRDRRLIGRALREVPPEGKVEGRRPGWRMTTALAALERHEGRARPAPRPAVVRDGAGPLVHFTERLDDWREIRAMFRPGEKGKTYDLATTAQLFGLDPGAILTWLRAGMPYAEEGNWETGEGFVLVTHWVLDWALLLRLLADVTHDEPAARRLRLVA